MKRMNTFSLVLAVSLIFTGYSASAENEKSASPTDQAVQAMTGKEKKNTRKKKASICAECGKPESECECKDHKKPESEHKEGDGHKH